MSRGGGAVFSVCVTNTTDSKLPDKPCKELIFSGACVDDDGRHRGAAEPLLTHFRAEALYSRASGTSMLLYELEKCARK